MQSSVPFCGACAVSTTEEIKEREDTSETDRRDRTQMRQGIQRRVVLELHWWYLKPVTEETWSWADYSVFGDMLNGSYERKTHILR